MSQLVRLTEAHREAFLAMAEDWRLSGDDRFADGRLDFTSYVRRLDDHEKGIGLPKDFVPATTFWLVDGDRIIGRSSIRHSLTPNLEREGGHVGYDIRPSERRKGYGTLILALTLPRASALGLHRVLVTCDEDNHASMRIIEKNGGVASESALAESGKKKRRYWIAVD